MCKCTPEKRTPFCGAPGCEWPKKLVDNGVEVYPSLLKKMGYTDKANRCDQCQHFSELEDPNIDRSWISVCDFIPVYRIPVSPHGCCDYFAPKAAPKT